MEFFYPIFLISLGSLSIGLPTIPSKSGVHSTTYPLSHPYPTTALPKRFTLYSLIIMGCLVGTGREDSYSLH